MAFFRVIKNPFSLCKRISTESKHIKIYTKTGDRGTSGLYSGERKLKSSPIFDALGTIDEFSACLGVAKEFCKVEVNGIDSYIEEIQSRLLDVGSYLATPKTSSEQKRERVRFGSNHVLQIESWIDKMETELPELTNFILPGGGMAAAHLHMARTVCRRAERCVVKVYKESDENEETPEESKVDETPEGADVMKYINRLSDFCFVAARYAAYSSKETEIVYKKNKEI